MTNFKTLFFGALMVLVGGFVVPAEAHKVIASAYAEGPIIEGEIGFSNGDMATDAVVEVFDDQDNKLGEATTDEDGIFQFTPTKAVPHIFKANLGAGHVAEFRMEVDDLPDGIGADASANAPVEAPAAKEVAAAQSELKAEGVDPAALKELIEVAVNDQIAQIKPIVAKAVRKETKPLRKTVAAYMEKNDMQAILGGIGYIVGLCGVGFYVAARMERKKAASANGGTTA
ncbi:nickel transport protein [Cohaesibacter sp. ES.047]|uniref:cobalt ABC transporter permease n=1 Tax=Cohaesibacter sp. ES.047 TaxID=1798205 RepID=UPI000BC02575|nr:cobalt ABC transporter permease [Cohaesibacter sp. ES.047]SNY93549.1 nickel transport protein [Cohaesibacter sp. ES.047]